MKERQNSTRWLGLALACGTLTFAVTTQAAKPPKPPPTPTGPAYRIVSLGNLGANAFGLSAINHVGWVAGGGHTAGRSVACVVVPEASADGPVYFRDTSPADGSNDLIQQLPGLPAALNSYAYDINNTGWVGGGCTMDNGSWLYETATIWVDSAPIDLGYVEDEETYAYGVNNLGLAVTGPYLYSYGSAPCYVVVPKDNSGDSVADTWFEDVNGDGINDLFKLVALQLGYDPETGLYYDSIAPEGGINDAGQIILNRFIRNGSIGLVYRLTPDYTDSDGDGNPWYADANRDGLNDLMVELIRLAGGYTVTADINAAGQVVGASNQRAVRWDFAADGTQTVTDLGSLSSKQPESMGASGINDLGQIVGGVRYRNSRTSFLFQNGKMYDLATLLVNGTGWTSLGASDINNQGIIAGSGYLNGVWQGFVAIPVTQP